jgi:hypothetical protein
VAAVSAALAAMPGPHDAFDAAYADFALQMYQRSIVWGKADGSQPRNWATYLPDVTNVAFQAGAPGTGVLLGAQVNLRGIYFGRPALGAALAGSFATSDAGVTARWVYTDADGAVHAVNADPAVVITAPQTKASLVVLRGNAAPGGVPLPNPQQFAGRFTAAAVAAPAA